MEFQQTIDGTWEASHERSVNRLAASIQRNGEFPPDELQREVWAQCSVAKAWIKTNGLELDNYRQHVWMMPLPETVARACRAVRSGGNGIAVGDDVEINPEYLADARESFTPSWYSRYLMSKHFGEVRMKAAESWGGRSRTCVINQRHQRKHWHHSDYGSLGGSEEYLSLVPMCDECHKHIRKLGPGLPQTCPDAVSVWII